MATANGRKPNPARLTNAERDMVAAHIPYALWWAGRYKKRARAAGLPWEWLTDACYRGLMDAVKRFDPTRGTKLGTYARGFVLRRISEAFRGLDDEDDDDRPRRPRGKAAGIDVDELESEQVGWRLATAVEDGALTEDDMELLYERVANGATQAEIAVRRGVSVRTIRSREAAAIRRFRQALALLAADGWDVRRQRGRSTWDHMPNA